MNIETEIKKIITDDTIVQKLVSLFNRGETKESAYWVPKVGEEYWYISENYLFVVRVIWLGDDFDKIRNTLGNVYRTKELAEQALNHRLATERLKRYRLEHFGDFKAAFEDCEQSKYYIYYDFIVEEFRVDRNTVHQKHEPWRYVETPDQAEQWARECADDWKIYFGV